MNPILYQSYTALSARVQALEVMANNLANAGSIGYKADRLFDEILSYEARSRDGSATGLDWGMPETLQQTSIDFSAGPVQQTGNPLHVALLGEGFFVVQTPRGIRYTRAGDFQLDAGGQLVNPQGHPILGTSGPLQIPQGTVTIDPQGTIAVDGLEAGRIKVVNFNDRKVLQKEGASLFMPADPAVKEIPAPATRLQQGALEGSNVNSIKVMTELLAVQRDFESLQRSLRMSMNDMTQRLIDETSRK